MSRASKEAMDGLHKLICTKYTDAINSFDGKDDKHGLAALLNGARQLLKDNEVTALGVPDSPIQSLASSLPFAGSEFSGEDDAPVH